MSKYIATSVERNGGIWIPIGIGMEKFSSSSIKAYSVNSAWNVDNCELT